MLVEVNEILDRLGAWSDHDLPGYRRNRTIFVP
jgi:hypothetical protein